MVENEMPFSVQCAQTPSEIVNLFRFPTFKHIHTHTTKTIILIHLCCPLCIKRLANELCVCTIFNVRSSTYRCDSKIMKVTAVNTVNADKSHRIRCVAKCKFSWYFRQLFVQMNAITFIVKLYIFFLCFRCPKYTHWQTYNGIKWVDGTR